jgi:hypothetical protein
VKQVSPLHAVMAETAPVLLIGDSSSERFPKTSFACYQKVGKAVHYLDMGRRDLSAHSNGQPILYSPQELGDWGGDLALIWVHPISTVRAVELAEEAGCKRLWFSFGSANDAALQLAESKGMKVLEVGRCPVLFLENRAGPCKVHGWVADALGLTELEPQLHAGSGRREHF